MEHWRNGTWQGKNQITRRKACLNVTLSTTSPELPALTSNQGPDCETQSLHSMGSQNKYEKVLECGSFLYIFLFSVPQQLSPPVGQRLLIVEALRHSERPHLVELL